MARKKTVTVVGNGKSLLDAPRGNMIDGSDVVVRFNNFRTEGYEIYTGEKTTWWYGYMQPHPQLRDFELVILSLYPKGIEKALQKRAQRIKDACNDHGVPFEMITETDLSLKGLYMKLGMKIGNRPKPSGGLIMVQRLIDNHDYHIQTVGMDCYSIGYQHYWDDTPAPNNKNHDPLTEMAYLRMLERKGKIIQL